MKGKVGQVFVITLFNSHSRLLNFKPSDRFTVHKLSTTTTTTTTTNAF